MKKIALIMEGWKHFFTFAWPAGILQRINETNEDVNLYIFNSSGSWNPDKDYNMGEYNIYQLPDLNDFDGIILDINNVRYKDVRENVIQAAKKTGKPVISIAKEIEDFYYVGIDNYGAMRTMIAHLHEEHNCDNFWFIMGAEDNYENQIRVQAMKDYMDAQGIRYSEDEFYYESFEYHCGYSGFLELRAMHYKRMPQAIICANDNIAVGVCEAAVKLGYKIPQDFCVTGFDNFDKAAYYKPQLTTVGHVREEVGYKCMELLLALWKGEEIERFHYTDTTCIFRESCGCAKDNSIDHEQNARDQVIYGIETADFDEQILSLEYELMGCRTIKEMTDWIPKCVTSANCDAMYLVLDEHINDFRKNEGDYDRDFLETEAFRESGYPDEMLVEFAYADGQNLTKDGQKIHSLFPFFEHPESGKDFLFMPLHFRNRAVGYFVIRNGVYLMAKQYLYKILNTLTSAMENLHKKEKLEYVNQVLADLNIKDFMTGMYNRFGYQKLAQKLFEEKKALRENLQILYFDMDRLKYLNDNYGHEYGDFAIKTIAAAILKNCPKYSVPVRTGGDEFVVIQQQLSPKELKAMQENIREEIRIKSEKVYFPFPLTVSIGCVVTDMETDRTLDDYIREADENMYEEKVKKKAER
ncbi:MAG: GGDEF domain-containing protein [Lachnospiraceae bacterium]|nr:GGDEF domain-containing protein [Lachnospiraceae bacterium]